MKQFAVLGGIVFLMVHCGTPKTSGGSNGPVKLNKADTSQVASKVDHGDRKETEVIPIYGKSTGVKPDLEGAWKLHAIGSSVALRQANQVNKIKEEKKALANKKDTIATTTINGVVYTTTTIYLTDKDGKDDNKLTPPQGQSMHMPAPPSLSFFGSNNTFSGYTGCNPMSGQYTISGSHINFKAAPSTRMACIGDYDEDAFITTLNRVNGFNNNDGKLELLEGNKVLLIFKKK